MKNKIMRIYSSIRHFYDIGTRAAHNTNMVGDRLNNRPLYNIII